VTSTSPHLQMRAEAVSLASQMLESPTDLIPRCRRLLTVMRALGWEGHECLATIRVVDSDADAWPIGVAPQRLDAAYHRRVLDEQASYCQDAWPGVQVACRAVLALLSRPNMA